MNEDKMRLEELANYAQEAKDQVEKRRLEQAVKKQQELYRFIKKIIDMLKEKEEKTVRVRKTGTNWFEVDDSEIEVATVEISINNVENVINCIPALESYEIEAENDIVLEVKFSETKANNTATQTTAENN